LVEGTIVSFNLTKDEWISVLKLSSVWEMQKVAPADAPDIFQVG